MLKIIKNIKFYNIIKFFSTLLSIIIFFGTIYFSYFIKNIPKINSQAFAFDLTSTLYDKNNNIITTIFKEENREWAEFEEIPKDFIDAVIATEDKTFWKHEGIDIYGIFRAILSNVLARSIKEGGSTLTQQLAKNVLIKPSDRSSQKINRKIKEALIAFHIEEKMNKKEIISNYLNIINFGQHAYGIKAAARIYFNKTLKELSLEESALLAGIPQSPSDQNPISNFKKAQIRKNIVLDRMVSSKYITQQKAEETKIKPIILNIKKIITNQKCGYFIDTAIIEAENILKEKSLTSLYSGGYSVYTTLDKKCQKILEDKFENFNNFPPDFNEQKAQAAMVVYEQKTGAILAIQGGREYETAFGLNRAITKDRQPGSTFKPIAAYGPAIELGLTANDKYIDGPININGYQPKNASANYQKTVTIRTAIKNSINTVAVQVLNDISPQKGYEFAKRLGIELSEEDSEHLSIALGGVTTGVSVIEMARAYGVFGNEGILEKPHTINKIINNNGEIVYEFKPEKKQVISPTVAWYINDLLQTVVNSGTGIQAKLPITMAGKTGTTELSGVENANKDLWFVGYTPSITGCVWIGFDKTNANNALYDEYGGGYSARLWKLVMSEYLNNLEDIAFKYPNSIEHLWKKFTKKNILGIPDKITKNKNKIKILPDKIDKINENENENENEIIIEDKKISPENNIVYKNNVNNLNKIEEKSSEGELKITFYKNEKIN